MVKLFAALAVLTFFSCNPKDDKTSVEVKSSNEVGVPNANGGIPDTTNAINLSSHQKDSTRK